MKGAAVALGVLRGSRVVGSRALAALQGAGPGTRAGDRTGLPLLHTGEGLWRKVRGHRKENPNPRILGPQRVRVGLAGRDYLARPPNGGQRHAEAQWSGPLRAPDVGKEASLPPHGAWTRLPWSPSLEPG